MKFSSLSIVIAAYNEQDSLPVLMKDLLIWCREHLADWEIILVDDGSTDNTKTIMQTLANDHRQISVAHLPYNQGMGAALRLGYAHACKTWLTMLPADGQIAPRELAKLLKLADQHDVVTSVYTNRRYSGWRKIMSKGLRVLTAVIVGVRAGTEGNYVLRRSVLMVLNPQSNSFLLNLEIPIRAKWMQLSVGTAHIEVSPRIAGDSKAMAKPRMVQTIVELFKLRWSLQLKHWRHKRDVLPYRRL